MFDIERARGIFEKYRIKKIVWYPDYPEKVHWVNRPQFRMEDFETGLREFYLQPTSLLYLHFPFCPKQCLFCNCKTKIIDNYAPVQPYLKSLLKEIKMHTYFCERNGIQPHITEVHYGGGSPTFMRPNDFSVLAESIKPLLAIDHLSEISIEIDPRHVKPHEMAFYHDHGINRVSFGIQDFDEEVQIDVDRMQPDIVITRLLTPEIRKMFPKGVNFDIICGLPKQTRESFNRTLDKVIEFSPDRISLLTMNMTPVTAPHQLLMTLDKIPSPLEAKVFLFDAIEKLTAHGYLRTGFDHFSKPEDSVAKAQAEEKMRWGSFGSTAGRYQDFLGLGNSGISRFPRHSAQNIYEIETWQDLIDLNQFPILRGFTLSDDDMIRRDVTQWLRIYPYIKYSDIEKKYGIDFKKYFAKELVRLSNLVDDDLIELKSDSLVMTDFGTLFADFISENFDAYVYPA
ncbi:MAG: oxygen-independent coproporphyrinogen III oxidase [bacterium]|nr:oxygen-independent coproporphyrinogen III oxidase [bacterium]